eukprot:5611753-Pyramimonas_sp.AAC.1
MPALWYTTVLRRGTGSSATSARCSGSRPPRACRKFTARSSSSTRSSTACTCFYVPSPTAASGGAREALPFSSLVISLSLMRAASLMRFSFR